MKLTVGQFLGIIVLVLIVGGAAFFAANMKKNGSGSNGKVRQAVFLTNNQVYFGYLSNANSQYPVLKDIYYLQVQEALQPAKDNSQPQVSLVKLGNELHGPKDQMRINRDQILFYEDMKDDSKVNAAITDFIKNGGPTATQPSTAPTTEPTKK